MSRWLLIPLAIVLPFAAVVHGSDRSPDIRFRIQMIDPGFSETVAVADLNNDGRPDIISGESWYEAPKWTKHPLRDINYGHGHIDDNTDLALDVDGDGWIDIVQFSYVAHNIVWLKNPGKKGGEWKVTEIDNSGPTEFAFLVDLNNDGKALELLPEFDRPNVPLAWFELRKGKWVKHIVSQRSYGHGIGVGDMNGDGRNDILTPQGWLEAPADVEAPGDWTFHPEDWDQSPIPPAGRSGAAMPAPAGGTATAGLAPGNKVRAAQFGYMYLIDINGDGRKDILTGMAHDYGLAWYEQTEDGKWIQHVIDNSWSQAHASVLVDLNGDGHLDFVTGKRYFAHNGFDPGEREPIGLYWYEFRKAARGGWTPNGAPNGGAEWFRHIIDYDGRMGGGQQIVVTDMDGDGDLDVVSGGEAGLFLAENMTKSPKGAKPIQAESQ
jgi:hypothetical protein